MRLSQYYGYHALLSIAVSALEALGTLEVRRGRLRYSMPVCSASANVQGVDFLLEHRWRYE